MALIDWTDSSKVKGLLKVGATALAIALAHGPAASVGKVTAETAMAWTASKASDEVFNRTSEKVAEAAGRLAST